MTLLSPPRAPVLAGALEAAGRGDDGAADALARAVAADEEVLVPTSDDGRHPLMTGPDDDLHLTAFTGTWLALWGHPWRPPVDLRPVSEVLGWVRSTGRVLRLDHASEADTRIGPDAATALLTGRPVDAAALAAGAEFRNPGPVASAPAAVLAPPAPDDTDDDGEVTFARGWDPAERRPIDPVPAGDLADVAAGYAAVRRRADRVEVLVFGEQVVVGLTYAPGLVHRWEWARFDTGLFQTEAGTAVDDGSPRPRPHLVGLARPDGLLRTWRARPDGSELTTSSTPDVSDRWVGVPPLGVFAPLVDPGA
ncbi:MAG TPA: hypothetical protein VGO60_09120 [Iamia sp.]|nr:hypothetical protein [Iamia sp.]